MQTESQNVTTANINGVKDSVEIIKEIYHMPDRESHVWTSSYVEKVLSKPSTEIFKLTHAQFTEKYRKRDFFLDFPAGYLVGMLDKFLSENNKPTTQIEYGNWPTIRWIKEMIRY